jgi:hypothetical protein
VVVVVAMVVAVGVVVAVAVGVDVAGVVVGVIIVVVVDVVVVVVVVVVVLVVVVVVVVVTYSILNHSFPSYLLIFSPVIPSQVARAESAEGRQLLAPQVQPCFQDGFNCNVCNWIQCLSDSSKFVFLDLLLCIWTGCFL